MSNDKRYNYAHEKFMVTVDALCTTPGTPQERLYNAVISQFSRLIPEENLPPDFHDGFNEIHNLMLSAGNYEQTILHLSDTDVFHIMDVILAMYDDLCTNYKI